MSAVIIEIKTNNVVFEIEMSTTMKILQSNRLSRHWQGQECRITIDIYKPVVGIHFQSNEIQMAKQTFF